VLLKQIGDEPSPLPLRAWLLFLARSAAWDVGLRLEQAGYLTRARSRVPGRPGRMVPVNPDWAFAPLLRVRSALSALLLAAAIVLAIIHFGTLLGTGPGNPAAWLLPSAFGAAAVAGLCWGAFLRARRPRVYATIGLGAHAAEQVTPASGGTLS
jgi:hypothetical protein